MRALCENVKITLRMEGGIGNWVGLYLEEGSAFLQLQADVTMS